MTGFPDGKFDILVIDPPWNAKKSNTHKARPNQTREMDYQLMDMDDIFDQVGDILENHACDKHNVFMWCIDRTLVEAEDRMSKMGYKVHARIVWDKGRGMSPCYTVRFTHEYLVWFFKPGHMVKPCKDSRGVFPDVLRAPSREHSRKPEKSYEMLNVMFPECSKVDVYSRQLRDGWSCWGNEVGKFNETHVKKVE